jgi:hypothetical protein
VPNLLIDCVMRNAHARSAPGAASILAETGRPVRSLPFKHLDLV